MPKKVANAWPMSCWLRSRRWAVASNPADPSAKVTIAVELLQAAKAGDDGAVADASKRWYANARQIADFISSLDRHVWPRKEMRSMMKTHLDQTLKEAQDQLTGNFAGSVRDYDSVHRHILEMADMLSDGIVKQFPRRFR